MLYLIGLGLADEQDITVKGLEIVKRAERVYLEAYTSILHVGKEKLVRWLSLLSLIRELQAHTGTTRYTLRTQR
jgi:diphthamide biosynthesis methyltransferase